MPLLQRNHHKTALEGGLIPEGRWVRPLPKDNFDHCPEGCWVRPLPKQLPKPFYSNPHPRTRLGQNQREARDASSQPGVGADLTVIANSIPLQLKVGAEHCLPYRLGHRRLPLRTAPSCAPFRARDPPDALMAGGP